MGMEKTNVLVLLTPKTQLAYLDDSMNIRQALEKMRHHGFMAIPVISKTGEYLGTISEGDLLWRIVDEDDYDLELLESIKVIDLIRKDYAKSAKVDVSMEKLVEMITFQNFVPIVDDRNILMGIITRRRVLQQLLRNENGTF